MFSVEAASAILTMLEGKALVLSQVAEYKARSFAPGSLKTISSSLGKILMELHTGMLPILGVWLFFALFNSKLCKELP